MKPTDQERREAAVDTPSRPLWSRVLDDVPEARPYVEAVVETFARKLPADKAARIAVVLSACVIHARMTGMVTPLVDLGMYLRSWGLSREYCQRFCRRLAAVMEVG